MMEFLKHVSELVGDIAHGINSVNGGYLVGIVLAVIVIVVLF